MNIIVTANMGNGTIQAKLEPLSRVECVDKIYFLRKQEGPEIDKVEYLTLPSVCQFSLFNLLLTPIILTYYVGKLKCSFILSYHIIPYAFFAAISSFITRRPYFVCQTGIYIQILAGNKIFYPFIKAVLMSAKRLCVPGSISKSFWQSMGIPEANIRVLHSTVDTDKYQPDDSMQRVFDFVYVGRISHEKRVGFLLKAFSKVKKEVSGAHLLILLGDGPQLDAMIRLSGELDLQNRVIFQGFQKDVLSWLHKSNSIVITSKTEGLPCALMEGMSAGLIPISTNVGNIPDVIEDGVTGFLADKNSMEEFANGMIHTLKLDEKKMNKIKDCARMVIVENHSHEVSQQKWEKELIS